MENNGKNKTGFRCLKYEHFYANDIDCLISAFNIKTSNLCSVLVTHDEASSVEKAAT